MSNDLNSNINSPKTKPQAIVIVIYGNEFTNKKKAKKNRRIIMYNVRCEYRTLQWGIQNNICISTNRPEKRVDVEFGKIDGVERVYVIQIE